MPRIRPCPELLLALILLPGCGQGGRTVWVTGKLIEGGAKYETPANQRITITFVASEIQDGQGKLVASTEPYMALYDPTDGSFKVPGRDGSGIPPGKYRVAITSKMDREALNTASPKGKRRSMDRDKDCLDNKFGVTTSPIIREIRGSADLTIDLDKPTEGSAG